MDAELQKYFETYEELFLTDGWKQLVEELKESMKELDSVSNCSSESDLFFRRGKLDILLQIATFKESIAQRREEYELDVTNDLPNPLEA